MTDAAPPSTNPSDAAPAETVAAPPQAVLPQAALPQVDWADRMEQAVLDAAVQRAGALGWSGALVRAACEANGLSLGDQELLFPNGPRDLAALLSRRHDARAMEILADTPASSLKIRERIARSVAARLEAAAETLEASKRCAGYLALPTHADLGLSLAWESADLLWRWSGDTATDWNHYSKRTILSGILIPALTMRLFDGHDAAEAFVSRRIDNVMTFEKWKAGKDFEAPLRKATDWLSRLRYGAGGQAS